MSFKELDALLEEAEGPRSRQSRSAPAERPLVLVIDDDEGIRSSLDLLLSHAYRLLLCRSAVEGVRTFNGDVCAVILDIKMKGYDGFWACDQIRKVQADVPIIFYSAYQDVKDPFEIINKHRPFGYITKNGDVTRLLDSLETATLLHQTTLRSRRILEKMSQRRRQIA